MNAHEHGCLDEDEVNRFAEGSGPPDDERLARHLHGCRSCRQLVAAVLSAARSRREAGDPLIGVEFGRYQVVERLGQGAGGLVYRAVDPSLGRSVALKLMRSLDDRTRRQLALERERLAGLVHPNVVRIYDTGEVSGDDGAELFVAMELVDGGSLRDRASEGELAPGQLVDYARQAARGLSAIHARGLVHRDVKPDNLLVASDGRLLIADLGLSASASAAPENLAGTPGYLAPELVSGRAPASAASDQYALCMSIAELALGSLERPPRAIGAALIRAGMSRGQARAIARGLAAEPAERHRDLEALAEALASRPRRRLAWFAAAATLALGVLAAIVWSRGAGDRCAAERERFAETFTADRIDRTLAVIAAGSDHDAGRLGQRLRARLGELDRLRHETCQDQAGGGDRAAILWRSACLEELMAHHDQALSLFERDPEVAVAAGAILGELGGSAECTGQGGLHRPPVPNAILDEVVRLRVELSRVKALAMRARYDQAAAAYAELAAEITSLGHLPLIADVRFAQAAVARARGLLDEADDLFRAAVEAAEAGGHEEVRALATAGLLSSPRLDPNLARDYIGTIEAIIARATDRPTLRASLRHKVAAYWGTRGEFARAYELFRDAAEDLASLPDADVVTRAQTELGVAASAGALGRRDEAEGHYRTALGLFIDAYGEDHPRVAVARNFLAGLLAETGRLEEALVLVGEARATFERVHGPGHPDVLLARRTECQLLTDLERFDRAEPRCVDLVDRAREADQSGPLWSALLALGQLRLAQRRPVDAIGILEEALASAGTQIAPIDRSEIDIALARALLDANRQRARAKRLLARARRAAVDDPALLDGIDRLLDRLR